MPPNLVSYKYDNGVIRVGWSEFEHYTKLTRLSSRSNIRSSLGQFEYWKSYLVIITCPNVACTVDQMWNYAGLASFEIVTQTHLLQDIYDYYLLLSHTNIIIKVYQNNSPNNRRASDAVGIDDTVNIRIRWVENMFWDIDILSCIKERLHMIIGCTKTWRTYAYTFIPNGTCPYYYISQTHS